ncbi:MAG: hypothetical protein NTX25_19270 [Proteobacteria bacterium]|nr:hypothetical protein [Pseudomonadota bacterium]
MLFARFYLWIALVLISYRLEAGELQFKPEEIQELAKEAVTWSVNTQAKTQDQLSFLHKNLMDRYPGKINPNPKWILNQTAGALGQLQILYCSTQEYLIFFGSTIGTEGHSGRHDMDIWDTMLAGEMWVALEGHLDRETFKPGQTGFLARGTAKAFKIPEYGYMLEYGRGNIIKGLGQGVLAPAAFINQDFKAMRDQLQECGKMILRDPFAM